MPSLTHMACRSSSRPAGGSPRFPGRRSTSCRSRRRRRGRTRRAAPPGSRGTSPSSECRPGCQSCNVKVLRVIGGVYRVVKLNSTPEIEVHWKTGYKKTGYKNNPAIRQFFPRTKSCNLSTVWIAYKNNPDIRTFSSWIKGILISGFLCMLYAV